jgi:hypothetical protein
MLEELFLAHNHTLKVLSTGLDGVIMESIVETGAVHGGYTRELTVFDL